MGDVSNISEILVSFKLFYSYCEYFLYFFTLTCVDLQMFLQIWWVLEAFVTLLTHPWTITQLPLPSRVPGSDGLCSQQKPLDIVTINVTYMELIWTQALQMFCYYAESKNKRGKSASWKSDRDGTILWISDLARCAKKT